MTSSTFPYISLYALHYQLQTPYLPTPTRVARCMLQLAEAKPGELVVDLGCGEGNVLIAAAKYFKCRCVGIEIDPRLAKRAKKRAEEEGVEDLVEIIMGDLFLYDLSSADIVTLYLLPKTIRLLQYKLAEELKDTAKVVSHDYPLENLSLIHI